MGRSAEVNIMQSLKDFVLTEFQKKSNTNAFSKLENNQLPPFSMTMSKQIGYSISKSQTKAPWANTTKNLSKNSLTDKSYLYQYTGR